MIGPIVNGFAIIMGGTSGAAVGKYIPERIRITLPLTFGACSMAMGVSMIVQVKYLPAVILAIILGTLIGELIDLETNIRKVSLALRTIIDKVAPQPAGTGISHEEFMEKYVAILVLFCASGTGIFGAMNEGMTGDFTMLIAKSFLDLFTAAIFAITLGYAVAAISIPQFIIQSALFFLAVSIHRFTSPEMIADFKSCGGIIMLATGFRIASIKSFPIANMLPALFIIMPISALWAKLVASIAVM